MPVVGMMMVQVDVLLRFHLTGAKKGYAGKNSKGLGEKSGFV